MACYQPMWLGRRESDRLFASRKGAGALGQLPTQTTVRLISLPAGSIPFLFAVKGAADEFVYVRMSPHFCGWRCGPARFLDPVVARYHQTI